MENISLYNQSNNYNNNNSNIEFNITQVLGAIKNKKDAQWFCLMNLKFFYNFRIVFPAIFLF